MLILMTVLVIFARLSTAGPAFFLLPAIVLTWFSLILVMATAGLLFSSVFFRTPIDLRSWLDPSIPARDEDGPISSLGRQISSTEPDNEVLQAISALAQYAEAKHSAQQTDLAVQQLKAALVRPNPPSRLVTKALIESIKTLRNADLHSEFSHGELQRKDIVNVDLSNTDLRGIRFDGAFMIETDLRGADLGGASFTKALVRNIDFAGSTMYGTDMTGADWFNAGGLTLDQLSNAKKGTVLPCPKSHGAFGEAGFQEFLTGSYGFPFSSWTGDVQSQLRSAWSEYGKPDGLCRRVAEAVPAAEPIQPQASAANPTATTHRKSSTKGRPFIFKDGVDLMDDENTVRVVFSNDSDYPAIEVATQIQWAIVDNNFDATTFEPKFASPSSSGDVGPHMKIEAKAKTGKQDLPDQFAKARRGELKVFVFGQATYRDLLGETYVPRFCVQWIPSAGEFTECPQNKFVQEQRP